MGSLLELLKEAPEEEQAARRWVTVLADDPGSGAPKFEVELEYLDPDDWERIARQYKPQFAFGHNWVQLIPSDSRRRLLKAFLNKTLKNVKGLGRLNLPRISALALKKGKGGMENVPEEIPFSPELIDDLASLITHDIFVILHTQACDLNEFGVALGERKE